MSISFAMTVILGLILFANAADNCPSVNRNNFIYIVFVLTVFWGVPVLLMVLKGKEHFSKSISNMLFRFFQITFWINLVLITIPVEKVSIRVLINCLIVVIGIISTFFIIRYELKPKSGMPNKKEVENIKKGILELEIVGSVMPKMNNSELAQIKFCMNSIMEGHSSIVHGVDSRILNECRALRNSALCNDEESIAYHIAFLGQLLLLSKQMI